MPAFETLPAYSQSAHCPFSDDLTSSSSCLLEYLRVNWPPSVPLFSLKASCLTASPVAQGDGLNHAGLRINPWLLLDFHHMMRRLSRRGGLVIPENTKT